MRVGDRTKLGADTAGLCRTQARLGGPPGVTGGGGDTIFGFLGRWWQLRHPTARNSPWGGGGVTRVPPLFGVGWDAVGFGVLLLAAAGFTPWRGVCAPFLGGCQRWEGEAGVPSGSAPHPVPGMGTRVEGIPKNRCPTASSTALGHPTRSLHPWAHRWGVARPPLTPPTPKYPPISPLSLSQPLRGAGGGGAHPQ